MHVWVTPICLKKKKKLRLPSIKLMKSLDLAKLAMLVNLHVTLDSPFPSK